VLKIEPLGMGRGFLEKLSKRNVQGSGCVQCGVTNAHVVGVAVATVIVVADYEVGSGGSKQRRNVGGHLGEFGAREGIGRRIVGRTGHTLAYPHHARVAVVPLGSSVGASGQQTEPVVLGDPEDAQGAGEFTFPFDRQRLGSGE
jgi:hypothetical protein